MAFTWALAAFVLFHIGVSATGLRTVLVGRLGEWPYRGLFSTATAILLGLMIWSFREVVIDPSNPLHDQVFSPPAWGRHATHGLLLLAFVFAVGGILSPSPTQVGGDGTLRSAEPARGFIRITRHPFMWGVAFWGAGHLFANGERYALMLFGALALMALYGTRSIDRKTAARDPENWERLRGVSSNVPFAAIVQGKNRLVFSELWWRILAGVGVFGLAAWLHGLAGLPVFP